MEWWSDGVAGELRVEGGGLRDRIMAGQNDGD